MSRFYGVRNSKCTCASCASALQRYDCLMRRTLLMQRMEEVLTPRELNLVRSYLGIGQPDEVGLTFQELAIRLNYNAPAERRRRTRPHCGS